MTILDMMCDAALLGPLFGPPFQAWIACLAAASAQPCPSEEAGALYRQCTGRQSWPERVAAVLVLLVGRGGGKTLIAALLLVYHAAFRDYRNVLGPGELVTAMLLAADRRQARVAMRYIRGLLHAAPMLKAMIVNETKESIELSNRVVIEVHTASFRSVRGYSIACAICDEVAFWQVDEGGANPDREIITALQPGLARVPGSMLIVLSTPYSRKGWLWDQYRRHYAQDDSRTLVWQAPSLTMNPTLDAEIIAAAYADDEAAAAAEYGAEFRRDIESYISRESVDACVIRDRRELPPALGVGYVGFADPSGGSQDSMTLAIAHADQAGCVVLDAVRERKPPFSPDDVCREFSELLRTYRLCSVTGDNYAREWPRERFRVHGINYEPSKRVCSDLYRELLPLMNSRRCELLDHPRLIAQLCALERRTGREGRDSIGHAPNAHDDVVNAAAGALVLAQQQGALRCAPPVSVGVGRSYWRVSETA